MRTLTQPAPCKSVCTCLTWYLTANTLKRQCDPSTTGISDTSSLTCRRQCEVTCCHGDAHPYGRDGGSSAVPAQEAVRADALLKDHDQARFWIIHAYPETCSGQIYPLGYAETIHNRVRS
ncbi:hypothetical protein Bbelb_251000 [Branchiostoma belcheri]|nr:hypothetical protein Bbelb_251000 [Branchiostoma belcheri]